MTKGAQKIYYRFIQSFVQKHQSALEKQVGHVTEKFADKLDGLFFIFIHLIIFFSFFSGTFVIKIKSGEKCSWIYKLIYSEKTFGKILKIVKLTVRLLYR